MGSKKGLHLLLISMIGLIFPSFSPESVAANTILQQQGTLERGDQVIQSDGSLADFYTFTGQAGQQIRITLESSEFDAYLILLDSNQNKIAENDDANQGTRNAELVLTLPESGTYAVVVNGYDRGDRGRYDLTIISAQLAGTTQQSSEHSSEILPLSSLENSYQRANEYVGLRYFSVLPGENQTDLPGAPQSLGGHIVYDRGEQLQPSNQYGVGHFILDGNLLILFEKSLMANTSGVRWEITDAIIMSANNISLNSQYRGEYTLTSTCFVEHRRDSEVFGIAKVEDSEYWTQFKIVLRANRNTGQLEVISSDNISCENPGWGV